MSLSLYLKVNTSSDNVTRDDGLRSKLASNLLKVDSFRNINSILIARTCRLFKIGLIKLVSLIIFYREKNVVSIVELQSVDFE